METPFSGRLAIGCALLGLAAGCGGPDAGGKAAQAVVNAGMAAAAMPLHQAITGCLTQCGYGTGCDEATGTCVDLEELAKQRRANPPKVAGDPNQPPPPAIPFAYDDSCAGMCMSDERCVMLRGELDCVPR